MNEDLDLTKILDGCPKGTKFYSPLFGELKFNCIYYNGSHDIELGCERMNRIVAFRPNGKYVMISMNCTDCEGNYYRSDECLLFPSKDQRDWSKFRRFWDKTEKFDPKFFQKDCPVLVRDKQQDAWRSDIFYGMVDELFYSVVCHYSCWKMGIPYNDDTKHLLGTKDDCPECYKWWNEPEPEPEKHKSNLLQQYKDLFTIA